MVKVLFIFSEKGSLFLLYRLDLVDLVRNNNWDQVTENEIDELKKTKRLNLMR